jgi:hypothetical protein
MKCKFNAGSNFDRKGQWVIAKYLDQAWVTGIVMETRVKYGGKIQQESGLARLVQHSILSDSPTYVNDELREVGDHFLVLEDFVTEARMLEVV